MNTATKQWFGMHFYELDPKIQALHALGGTLKGRVSISYGNGLSGIIGKRIASKLGIPTEKNTVDLNVDIQHSVDSLLWSRQFEGGNKLISTFKPFGSYPDGYWVENTGFISLVLKVNIINGGWHWVQNKIILNKITVPLWLFPKITAYKTIEDQKYVFSVSFRYPVLGELFSYSGQLIPNSFVGE